MVGRLAKITGMTLAYALYTLAVTAMLLWYLFPANTVRDWLRFRLHRATPGLEWRIGQLGLALPGRLVLSDVRISRGQGPKGTLLTLSRVSMGPDVMAMLHNRQVRGLLHVGLASGSVDAKLAPRGAGRVEVQGQVRGIRLEQLKGLQAGLGRKMRGTLSGTFHGRIDLDNPRQGRMQADLLLEQGELAFRRPVLGLDRLPFGRIGTSVVMDRGKVRLEKGRVESRLLRGDFHGSLVPGRDLAASAIRVQGTVRPRPELFARLGSNTMSRLVRSRLKKGALAFTVSGTLAEPGILFPALAGAMGRNLPGEER